MKKILSSLVVGFMFLTVLGGFTNVASAWNGTWSFEESCTLDGKIDVEATYTPLDEHGGTVGYDSAHTDLEVGDEVLVSLVEDHGQASSYTVTNTEDCTPPTDECPNIEGNQEVVPNGMHQDEEGDCVDNDKVDICHATANNEDPYNAQAPNKSADVSGHDGHNGPIWFDGINETWGDIIPPFTFPGGSYAGQNWNETGMAIFFNNCDIPEDLNNAPLADAGPDQVITLPTNSVTLDGSNSSDSDGTIASFVWTFVSGPSNVDPSDTETSSASGLVAGTYVFQLEITDNDGATDTDTVSITVNPQVINPQCSDDVDNADAEDTLADELDPGCHTDSNPDNTGSYNPNDDDETDLPECSDGKDNADTEDTLADASDPGCHTDGNPENTGSYVPTDNNETDEGGNGGGGDNECEDNVDNSDPEDTLADELDPGCHTDSNPDNTGSYNPNDDDETDEGGTGGGEFECSDEVDNDGDDLIDELDPGCHDDGDENNEDSYDPTDDSEEDQDNSNSNRSSGSSRRRSVPQGEILGAQTCGIYVEKYLRVGYSNDVDTVVKVQNFLNNYMNAGLIVNGIYGIETADAVSAFQLQHSDTVLAPWGISAPTGIFYLTTQTEVNNIMCPDLNLPIPSNLINWSASSLV